MSAHQADRAQRAELLEILETRGYLQDVSDRAGLLALAESGPISLYVGYDCTADSLHVGSLISIMMLRWAQRCGHRPIVLMGGGTTKVGDPSGRDESRKLLSDAEIEANKASIKRCFASYLTFGPGPTEAIMVDNAEWLDKLAYIPFLREFGRHFSVNRMLSFDSVKLRLEREQPLSFIEFNYMILQAYDFMELARRHDCRLQMGGSDQWGNIVNGIELGRRVDGRELYGITCPLLTTSSGAKMGKTAAGAVWLNADRLSPWDFWQYWRNTEDADVPRFLKLYTELPLGEIARLAALKGAEINEAKKVLATAVTALAHGSAAAEQAAATARQAFEQGQAAADLPTITVPPAELAKGVPAFELFRRAGLAASNSEARRLIRDGGARVNDKPVAGEMQAVTAGDLADGAIKLSAGKKRHVLVRAG